MKRLFRKKSLISPFLSRRDVLNISEGGESNVETSSELAVITEEGRGLEHEIMPLIMSNEYNSGITSRGHRGSEKSPRQPSPSPPAVSPVSASTSTPSPSGTTRSGPPFYTSSPPSYSSLVDRDDSQALATHYLTSTGDNSGIIRTPGKVHSDQKGNRSTNEEEEVEDRAELTRMIGHLTATGNEDWGLLIELCERASTCEANAKEVVKGLRWEFKYGEPATQFAAAQLWAILFRNSSNMLLKQMQSQKFLDTLEDVLTSPRTGDAVKGRLMEVLGAVTYACGNDASGPGLQNATYYDLWCRLKSKCDPEEGIPFDIDDEILNPSTPPASLPQSPEREVFDEHFTRQNQPMEPLSPALECRRSDHILPSQRSLQVSIQSHNASLLDEDTRRLYSECKIAQSNANLLREALSYAKPEDIEKELILGLRTNCLSSRQVIATKMAQATLNTQQSGAIDSPTRVLWKVSQRNAGCSSSQSQEDGVSYHAAVEEEPLAALSAADDALQEALRIHNDFQRIVEERRADETGSRFVSTDRKRPGNRNEYGVTLEGSFNNASQIPLSSSGRVFSHVASSIPSSPSVERNHLTTQIFYSSAGSTGTVQPLLKQEQFMGVGSTDLASSSKLVSSRRESAFSQLPRLQTEISRPENENQISSGSAFGISPTVDARKTMGQKPDYVDSTDKGSRTPSSHLSSPYTPEEILTYNPWDSDCVNLASSNRNLDTVMPWIDIDSPISPLQGQNIPQLPDFTGRINREGEYPVGRGGFADVWKGMLRSGSGEQKVAVKVLQARVYDSKIEQKISKEFQRIRREIAIWKNLSHENVLPLLGITFDFGRYTSLVSPWLENGSLMQYLDRNSDDLDAGPRLQLACEVAAGLSYLHSSQVVHGDLTGANVLITDQGKACLCDFGLSTLMIAFHGTSFYTSTIGGNARWAAPEIYRVTDDEVTRSVTVQSDVYSFGCIMLEIFSGQVPYHYLVREGQVLIALQNGTKPKRPEIGYMTDSLWDIINTCWADTPNDRPTMEQVWRCLKRQIILENLPC